MSKILEIKNLTKYYGKVLGVEDLSLTLHAGEIFGLIGPNGAGKSTTIRSIMNLINKTGGEVFMDGEALTKDNVKLKKEIAYLPSEVYLYEDLTVREMLDYHESFYEKNLHDRRCELVKIFQLDEKKKIEDLSLGNLKKLGIVLAFMSGAKLLILDEPTSGLDPMMQQVFYHLLKEEKKKGTTIIYSTHILNEISKVCDRVGIIREGRLLRVEEVTELIKKELTSVTITSKDSSKIIKNLKVEATLLGEDTISFPNTIDANLLIRKLSNYSIDKLLIEESSLEDVLLYYYK